MDDWYIEQNDEPLFADVLWSRPETVARAAKILLIGGSTHGFHSLYEAHLVLTQHLPGTATAVLPESLKKHTKPFFSDGEFVAATPSGSFSKKSLSHILTLMQSHDGLLIPGDIENNSETILLLEQIIEASSMPLGINKDVLALLKSSYSTITTKENLVLECSFAQLQRFATEIGFEIPFTSEMNFEKFAEALKSLSEFIRPALIVERDDTYLAVGGRVCRDRSGIATGQALTQAVRLLAEVDASRFEVLCTSTQV